MYDQLVQKKVPLDIQQEIIDGFISGSQIDFSCLYDKCSTPLFQLILTKARDVKTAEKILELTFLQAWNLRRQYSSSMKSLILWLYEISKIVSKENAPVKTIDTLPLSLSVRNETTFLNFVQDKYVSDC